jgi:hypothetical protein
VVELYLSRLGGPGLAEAAARAGIAAAQMRAEGTRVSFLRSIFLPGDEICFLLFEGPSAEAVSEAVRRAAISFERVVAAEIVPDETLPMGTRTPLGAESSRTNAREVES